MSARNRFASTTPVRIDLSDGLWISVKPELDAGDQRIMDTLAIVPMVVDGKVLDRVDWSKYELMRTHLWLVDWNMTRPNADGKDLPVSLTLDAIRALKGEDFDEINDAVYAHIMGVLAEKKSKRMKESIIQPGDKSDPTLQ